MNARGYFFCESCDDVVNLSPVLRPLAKCPVCHHLTARWVPDEVKHTERVVVSPEGETQHRADRNELAAQAALWFARMHQAVEAAG